jgi:BirA family biotin operon repressor/biotin-[acetyl-CoA-carboxylase] ligase
MSKKAEILFLLKESRPEYISGEEICQKINISRTAVWKHINTLREEGYVIEAVPNRGYSLVSVPDRLYADEIQEGLDTGFVGKAVFFYDSLFSTNRQARDLAQGGAVGGTLVVTEEQTAGKGRMGRGWYSPKGTGVTCSLILRPAIEPGQAPPVTMLTAVAVASAVERVAGVSPGIKWPNDLLLDGKKICGILTEMNAEMERIHFLVVGVGINVNTDYFPEDIKDIATSLYLAGGRRVSRLDLLRRYLMEFEHYYQQWMDYGFGPVLEEWKKRCVTLNRPVRISTPRETWEGWAVDVDNTGALVLRTDDGELKNFVAGEVSLRTI